MCCHVVAHVTKYVMDEYRDEPSEREFCCSVLELVERTTVCIQEEFIGAISERRRELIQLYMFGCVRVYIPP